MAKRSVVISISEVREGFLQHRPSDLSYQYFLGCVIFKFKFPAESELISSTPLTSP